MESRWICRAFHKTSTVTTKAKHTDKIFVTSRPVYILTSDEVSNVQKLPSLKYELSSVWAKGVKILA